MNSVKFLLKKSFWIALFYLLAVIAFFAVALSIMDGSDLPGFHLDRDASTRATIVGALVGTAAVFVGNLINSLHHVLERAKEADEKRNAIRTFVASEVLAIYHPHLKVASALIDLDNLIARAEVASKTSKSRPHQNFLLKLINGRPINKMYKIPETKLINALITDLLFLSAEEVRAVLEMHQGLEETRAYLSGLFQTQKDVDRYREFERDPLGGMQIKPSDFSHLRHLFVTDCLLASRVLKVISKSNQGSGKIIDLDTPVKDGMGNSVPLSILLANPENFYNFKVLAKKEREDLDNEIKREAMPSESSDLSTW